MTKQELIQQAYGKHWDTVKNFVDDNGWATGIDYSSGNEVINFPSLNDMGINEKDNYADVGYDAVTRRHVWRPKSLNGIENNNGWINISGKMPKSLKEGLYYTYSADDFQDKLWIHYYRDGEFSDLTEGCQVDGITHYRLLDIPKDPTY